MTRIEITLGLLTTIATVLLIAVYGAREEHRMETLGRAFDVRSVERGAEMYEQYCASCHGFLASGGKCPPLNQYSGLQGGQHGPGIAWRLEELGLDRSGAYEYVYGVIANGRSVSTRPWRWAGNRTPTDPNVMAMPAWGQEAGGPLRPDQIRDLTNFVVAFEDFIPTDPVEAVDQVAAWRADETIEMVSMDDAPEANPRPSGDDPVALGAWLFETQACVTCHAIEGLSVANACPPLDGIGDVALARIAQDDYTGDADTASAYILESIVAPAAYIVDGYADGVMPASYDALTEEELDALLAFLLGGPDAAVDAAAGGGAGDTADDEADETLADDEDLADEDARPADEVVEDAVVDPDEDGDEDDEESGSP